MVEFKLHEVLIASISQVMTKSNGKRIKIVDNLAPNLSNETLYGDSLRLQQVLAAFLLISVDSTPSGGQLGVAATLAKDSIGEFVQIGRLECRYVPSNYMYIAFYIIHPGASWTQLNTPSSAI